MSQQLNEAMEYAAKIKNMGRDMRPLLNDLQQHIRALSAEVERLRIDRADLEKDRDDWRDTACDHFKSYEGAASEAERLQREVALWKRNASDLEEELTHRAGERAELHVLAGRAVLTDALIEAYRAQESPVSDAIVAATAAIFEYDAAHPKPAAARADSAA